MLRPSPVIKKTAKTALSNHWLQAVAVSVTVIFCFFIGLLTASLVNIVAKTIGYIIFLTLFFVFVFSPLMLGMFYWFRRLLWGQTDSVFIVFKYFSTKTDYKKAIHLTLILTVKILCAAAILYFPCVVVFVLSGEWFYALFDLSLPIWTSSMGTLNIILAIVATFALVFVALRYYLSPFLFVCDDNMHPGEAVNMSTIISRRTGADFFGLSLSFAGWIIASVFVAPLIFTLPYFLTSYGVHCRYAIAAYNRDVDRFNAKDTPFYSTDEV